MTSELTGGLLGSSDTAVWEPVPDEALPEAYISMLHAIGRTAVTT